MTDSVPSLLRKIIRYRPKLLCIVGKSVWDAVQRALKNGSKYGIVTASAHDDAMTVNNYGLQLYRIMHSSSGNATTEEGCTYVYVVPSTSGHVVQQQTMVLPLFEGLKLVLEELKAGHVSHASDTTKVYLSQSG